MANIISSIVLLSAFLSPLTVVFGKICPKELTNPATLAVETVMDCCKGYREINRTDSGPICEPICVPPCGYGECFSPNRCACDFGYKHSKNGTCVEDISASTQILSARATPCGTCSLGICVHEKCECRTGYKLSPQGNCEPVCSKGCSNGQCIMPENCACQEGFEYVAESAGCQPLCNGQLNGCSGGTCVDFNKCSCANGAVLHADDQFRCVDGLMAEDESNSWAWYLLILLIPAALAAVGIVIFTRRRTARSRVSRSEIESLSI